MANKNRKTPSLIGNIISVYVLFFLLSRFVNIQSLPFNKVSIIIVPLLVFIGLVFWGRNKNFSKDKSESNDFSIRDDSLNKINEPDSNLTKYLARNKVMRKKTEIMEPFSNIDRDNHYVKQYKELYETGIMTKEELNYRISKLAKK